MRLACLLVVLASVSSPVVLHADELAVLEGCTLVPADWADGDSFRIRTPTGEEHTVRLYGVDCLETHVTGETDARRLRSQRRYFGIAEVRPDAAASIEFAKQLATQATAESRGFLARPFTIHTSFADGRGDGRFKRGSGPTPTGKNSRWNAGSNATRNASLKKHSTAPLRRRGLSSTPTPPRGTT